MARYPQTPAEAAWRAWLIGGNAMMFDQLSPEDKERWQKVADAVIHHAKASIADEMIRAGLAAERSLFSRPQCRRHV